MVELAEEIRPTLDQFATPLQRSRFFRSLFLLEIKQGLATDLPDETFTYAQTSLAASRESGDLLENCFA